MSGEESNVDQAKLPKALEEPTIRSMEVGASCYAYSGALLVDGERRCWLIGTALVFPELGLARMFVQRRSDGYHVTTSAGTKYRVEEPTNWDASVLVPVVSVSAAPPEPAAPERRRRWWQL